MQARSLPKGFSATVNSLIEQSERNVEQGVFRGMAAKKVLSIGDCSTDNSNRKSIYIFDSKWNCNDIGEGSVTISIYKTDASSLGL